MPPGKLPAGPRSDSNAYQSIPLVSIARLLRMVSRLVGAGGRSAGGEQPRRRAEGGVGLRGLGRVIGRRVAAHHGRGGVAEEVLHVQLPGLVLDRPGGGRCGGSGGGWRVRRPAAPSRAKRVPNRYLFIGPRGFLGRSIVRNNGPSPAPRNRSMYARSAASGPSPKGTTRCLRPFAVAHVDAPVGPGRRRPG